MYIREISPLLLELAKYYPILCINGPRQSGKTTLAQILFPHLPYVLLEDLTIRSQAKDDPKKFLAKYPNGAIFDEVQYVPELFSYLQGIVDNNETPGRYILTGSQNFIINKKITQSLAGRIGISTLLPLSLSELKIQEDPNYYIFNGGYPRLHKLNMPHKLFYPSYVATYIERDVNELKIVQDLHTFRKFLKLCAGRVGQLVNFSSLAQDCGISPPTAQQWLNILQASYLVFFLQPYHNNFNKRLIKMPKLYFYDTGLACHLLDIENKEQLDQHYQRGALFENLIILELLKKRTNTGLPPNIYFWRDRTGHEIDLLMDWNSKTYAIEIKSADTFQKDYIHNVKYFSKLAKDTLGSLVYTGTEDGSFSNINLIPFIQINQFLQTLSEPPE